MRIIEMKAQAESENISVNSCSQAGQLVFDTSVYNGQTECDLSYICVDRIDETGLAECCELLLRHAYFKAIDWTRLPNLKALDLSNSKILELNTAGFESLELLDISSTQLIDLNTTHLRNLRCLTAIDVSFEHIDTSFLVSLETFKLCSQHRGNMVLCTVDFGCLCSLTTLETNAEMLKSSVGTIFQKLETLTVRSGYIQLNGFSFPALRCLVLDEYDEMIDLGSFDKLERLELKKHSECNVDIQKLARFKHLTCCNADIRFEMRNLSNFSNLEALSIRSDQISVDCILQLTKLRSLAVRDETGTQIDFGAMTWLSKLVLVQTGIKQLNISNMQRLEALEINEDKADLKTELIMPNLRILKLEAPKLQYLDTNMMPQLRELELRVTAITQLDTACLTELEALGCQHNELKSLVLSDLPHLREVVVSQNRNSMAVVELDNLPALKRLEITKSQIGGFSLQKLDRLRKIEFDGLKADSIACGELPAFVRLRLQATVAKTASGCFEINQTRAVEDGAYNLMVAPGFAPNLQNIKTDSADILNLQLTACSSLHVVQLNDLCVLDAAAAANVRILEIDSSVQAEQLQSFGQLTNLRQLTCEWDLETAPDFSKLQSLEKLDIVANKVHELDFSKLTALKWLKVSCNRLERLELGTLPQLAHLHVWQYRGASIAELDVTGLQALQVLICNAIINEVKFGVHAALRAVQMSCVKNCSFDASAMPGLLKMFVHCFQGEKLADQLPSSLIYLKIQSELIKQLDLSNASKLQCLEVFYTKIADLDIRKLRNLAVLYLNSQISVLTTGEHPHLRKLELRYAQLGELDLTGMPALAYLELHNVVIGKMIVKTLNSLVDLCIGYTKIGNLDLNAMPNLRSLEIRNTRVAEFDTSTHTDLRCLKLKNAAIDNIDLSAARLLEELEVGGTKLWFSNAEPCVNLLKLRIGKISGKTMDLKHLQNLVELDISESEMTDLDISCLQKLAVFKANKQLKNLKTAFHPRLTELDLSATQLTSLDISQMPSLEELDAAKSKIAVLHTATHLRMCRLDVSNTAITRLDLRGMPNLKEFAANVTRLRYCDFGSVGFINLLALENTRMRFVRLPLVNLVELGIKVRFCDFRDLGRVNRNKEQFVVFSAEQDEDEVDVEEQDWNEWHWNGWYYEESDEEDSDDDSTDYE